MSWYQIKNNQVILKIYVKPNAKKTRFVEINENGMVIALHAKPQDGEANAALKSFLSTFFKLAKTHILLHKGQHSKIKQIILPLNKCVADFLKNPREISVK